AYATDETNTTDKWVYVSFVQGKEVAISDFKNDASWDIAFHRMDVRLNGGESGKGQGAGQISDVTALSELTTIPTEGYITDVMDSVNVSMMEKVAAPKNLTLGTWVSMAGMPPAYTVKENVFVVKSAEGKHVKLKFLDYLNAENKGGHVKFTYVYMD
ncbi:MAG: HmuY family protein, partial [Bacteroidales bacterium]|nr:HmuY family protein [Bacteroidales bacterium]